MKKHIVTESVLKAMPKAAKEPGKPRMADISAMATEMLGYVPEENMMNGILSDTENMREGGRKLSRTLLLGILKRSGLYAGVIYSILKITIMPEKSVKSRYYRAKVKYKVNETRCPAITAENPDPFKALFHALSNAMPWGIEIVKFHFDQSCSGQTIAVHAVMDAQAAGKSISTQAYSSDIYTAAAEAYADIANFAAAIFAMDMKRNPFKN